MIPILSFFSLATVSKSLLRVLGTFQDTAVLLAVESAALWKTKACLPQGLDNPVGLTTLPTTSMSAAISFQNQKILALNRARTLAIPSFFPLIFLPSRRTVRMEVLRTCALACEAAAPRCDKISRVKLGTGSKL